MCLVSFRVVIFSACSWPSQRSCFFRNFHLPLAIVHPHSGSIHVVKSFVVMIFISSTCSAYTCDKSRILTKPAKISGSRNQVFPITCGVSCSRRRRGPYTAVGIKGASHRMFLRMNSKPFLSIGLLTIGGLCVEICLKGSISLLHSLCSSVKVCYTSLLHHSRPSFKIMSVIAGAN